MLRYILFRIFFILIVLFVVATFFYITGRMFLFKRVFRAPYDMKYLFDLSYNSYKLYVSNIVHNNDWGVAGPNDTPVWQFVMPYIKNTLILNFVALAIYLPLGVLFGVICSLNRGKFIDKFLYTIMMIPGSIPHFFLILLLIIYLGVRNRILPASFPGFGSDLPTLLKGFVIPMIALCSPAIFKFMIVIRGELNESADDNYLLLCHVKGLNTIQTTYRHRLKNNIIAIMPELTPMFLNVLAGAFFVELIYSISGASVLLFRNLMAPIGDVYFVSINFTLVVPLLIFYVGLVLVFGLVVDMVYYFIDPRIRIGSKKNDIG
jgi:oligopeptide transport system permease protein